MTKSTAKKAASKRREPRTVAELKAEEQLDRELELQRRKERAARPEPEDTTSDEWRYWKIANLRLDFRSGNTDAYRRAHAEFRELLTGLYHDENFWHVSNALALLPHLIIARQEIEKMERADAEDRAKVMDEAKRAVLSIVAEEACDAETIVGLLNALASDDPDLPELVRRVKAGEFILDLTQHDSAGEASEPQPLIQYAPEIEARRKDYEALAEAFVTMADLETERAYPALDLPHVVYTHEERVISKAVMQHFQSLMSHADFFDPRTIRKFYVEMRLWGDHLHAELVDAAKDGALK